MGIVVHFVKNSGWHIRMEGPMGVVDGRSAYRTKEEALKAVKQWYPGRDINVEDIK